MKLNTNINLRSSQDLDLKFLKTIKASYKYESQDTEVKHSINSKVTIFHHLFSPTLNSVIYGNRQP